MAEPPYPVTQLPLALRLAPSATFATFVAGRNDTAVTHVRSIAAGERHDTVWLAGEAGVGKSHLLQAACAAADSAGRRAIYVPLDRHRELAPEVLADLDLLDVVALDAVDAVVGQAVWERALFGVLNPAVTGQPGGVLLAARHAPGQIGFALRDLASRAAGAVLYRLAPLAEDDQIEALARHAASRGLTLDEGAARFLVHRVARDMGTLSRWLDRLDAAALAAQKQITIPLIRALLEQCAAVAAGEVAGDGPR